MFWRSTDTRNSIEMIIKVLCWTYNINIIIIYSRHIVSIILTHLRENTSLLILIFHIWYLYKISGYVVIYIIFYLNDTNNKNIKKKLLIVFKSIINIFYWWRELRLLVKVSNIPNIEDFRVYIIGCATLYIFIDLIFLWKIQIRINM